MQEDNSLEDLNSQLKSMNEQDGIRYLLETDSVCIELRQLVEPIILRIAIDRGDSALFSHAEFNTAQNDYILYYRFPKNEIEESRFLPDGTFLLVSPMMYFFRIASDKKTIIISGWES